MSSRDRIQEGNGQAVNAFAGHVCSAYCGREHPSEHCELIYTDPNVARPGGLAALRDALWQSFASFGVWITDAVPAREAPSIADQDPAMLAQLAGTRRGTALWLVWWRTDCRTARAEYADGRIPRWRTVLEEAGR